jgi:hypothetical protein
MAAISHRHAGNGGDDHWMRTDGRFILANPSRTKEIQVTDRREWITFITMKGSYTQKM